MVQNTKSNFIQKHPVWLTRLLSGLILLIILVTIPLYQYYWNFWQKRDFLADFKAFYNSSDQEPMKSNLLIGPEENLSYLDQTIKNIFPEGTENLSDEAKAIEIERFVAGYMKNGSNTGSATKILQDGYAQCGGMSYVFRILNRKLKLPARYVGLFNTPGQGGHVLAEIYYNQKWHLFDPTFGVFAYSNPTYDGKGYILSMAELRQNPDAGYVFQVVDKPWVGSYSQELKSFGVKPVGKDYLPIYDYGGFGHYWRNEIKSAFPVAYGATSYVSLPIDIDLENSSYKKLDVKDNTLGPSYTRNQFNGFNYLGKTRDVPGIYNTWLVKIDAPKDITVRYWSSETLGQLEVIRLRSTQMLEIKREKEYTDLRLRIMDNTGIFMVIAPQGSVAIDKIEIFKE